MSLRDFFCTFAVIAICLLFFTMWGAGKMCGPDRVGIPIWGKGVYCVNGEFWRERP